MSIVNSKSVRNWTPGKGIVQVAGLAVGLGTTAVAAGSATNVHALMWPGVVVSLIGSAAIVAIEVIRSSSSGTRLNPEGVGGEVGPLLASLFAFVDRASRNTEPAFQALLKQWLSSVNGPARDFADWRAPLAPEAFAHGVDRELKKGVSKISICVTPQCCQQMQKQLLLVCRDAVKKPAVSDTGNSRHAVAPAEGLVVFRFEREEEITPAIRALMSEWKDAGFAVKEFVRTSRFHPDPMVASDFLHLERNDPQRPTQSIITFHAKDSLCLAGQAIFNNPEQNKLYVEAWTQLILDARDPVVPGVPEAPLGMTINRGPRPQSTFELNGAHP